MFNQIMVVDDEEGFLRLISHILHGSGFLVVTASDATEALDVLDFVTPDLLILDRMMPGMDGIALCRMIRARSKTTQTPIIMLTARTDSESATEALAAGANAYLTKPILPPDLVAAIRAALHAKEEEANPR
jgi:DNA-binding response OmpR family regulator